MENEKNQEKKKFYKKWWFWAIIIVIIIAIVAGGSNNNNNNNNTTEKTEYSQGEQAIWGDAIITVTGVEKSQGNEWDNPDSGKEFVIVSVTIENNGNSNLSYNPLDFKMQNSQGQQEGITFSTIDQDTALSSGELIPGGKISGTLIFEEPTNDTGLILVYNNNVWSSKELKIKLN